MGTLKKILLILIVIILGNSCSFSYAENASTDDLDIFGEGAILIDEETGQILYEKNANKQLYPASTTKIMTGILAIELGDLNEKVTITDDVIEGLDGTHIALEPGEELTLNDLVHALLIGSANDAAVAIAIHISGSVEEFVKLMNEKAEKIGALNTHFENPNGLPNDEHMTTAYDLSLIAKYAMKNKTFRDIVKNYYYIIPTTNKKDESRYLQSSNRLLYSQKKIDLNGETIPIKYDGVDGVKSGYTSVAQNCLVTSAKKGNTRLISVVLKSQGRNIYIDTHKLLNYGFNNFDKNFLTSKNEFIGNVKIKNGTNKFITGVSEDDFYVYVPKDNSSEVKTNISLPSKLEAPISKGQALGKIEYFLDGNSLGYVNIVSTENVEAMPLYRQIIENYPIGKWWLSLIILFVFWRMILHIKKTKRRKRKSFI